jgi:hypothetical protein
MTRHAVGRMDLIFRWEISFSPVRQVYRLAKEGGGEEIHTAYHILEMIRKVRLRLADMETATTMRDVMCYETGRLGFNSQEGVRELLLRYPNQTHPPIILQ